MSRSSVGHHGLSGNIVLESRIDRREIMEWEGDAPTSPPVADIYEGDDDVADSTAHIGPSSDPADPTTQGQLHRGDDDPRLNNSDAG